MLHKDTFIQEFLFHNSAFLESRTNLSNYHVAGPKVAPSGNFLTIAVPKTSLVLRACAEPHQSGIGVSVRFSVKKMRIVPSARPISRPAEVT